jgi:hypothetical protein
MVVDLDRNANLLAHDISERFDMSSKAFNRIMNNIDMPDILSYEWLDKCLKSNKRCDIRDFILPINEDNLGTTGKRGKTLTITEGNRGRKNTTSTTNKRMRN